MLLISILWMVLSPTPHLSVGVKDEGKIRILIMMAIWSLLLCLNNLVSAELVQESTIGLYNNYFNL